MNEARKRKLTAGAILIVIGLTFFLAPRYDLFETEYVFLILGGAFLVGYFVRRRYGLLVPGGVLFGLGLGALFDDAVARFGDGDQLGLGVGFLLIYGIALATERRAHWWPLIPGGFLILSGLDRTEEVAKYFFDNWPLILVVVGIFLVFGGLGKGRQRGSG